MKSTASDLSDLLVLSPEAYIQNRVDDQMSWYDRKAVWNQKRYKTLKMGTIILSVSIPFFTGLINEQNMIDWKVIVGIMGVAIAAIEGILSLQKYQENWISYRATAEQLKREKLLFQARAGIYRDAQDFPLFVARCEQIMDKENNSWLENQIAELKAEKEPEEEA